MYRSVSLCIKRKYYILCEPTSSRMQAPWACFLTNLPVWQLVLGPLRRLMSRVRLREALAEPHLKYLLIFTCLSTSTRIHIDTCARIAYVRTKKTHTHTHTQRTQELHKRRYTLILDRWRFRSLQCVSYWSRPVFAFRRAPIQVPRLVFTRL